MILSDINLMTEANNDLMDDRPPSPLPVMSRKPAVKSNSMKRSTTYFPSSDVNVGRPSTTSVMTTSSAPLSHRRSQSATFLSQQISANANPFKAAADFPKSKKTIFDNEVCSDGFSGDAPKHFFGRNFFFSGKMRWFRFSL